MAIAGRSKLRLVSKSYGTAGRRGGLFSLADMQAVVLHNGNLEAFLRTWESTLQGFSESQPVKKPSGLVSRAAASEQEDGFGYADVRP